MTVLPVVRVWSLDLRDPKWKKLDGNIWLDETERERCARFLHVDDARNYEASHKAMRWLLASELDCPPGDVAYDFNPWGKPHIRAGPQFSLSHSSHRALFAMGTCSVGIDLEACDRATSVEWFASVWSSAEKRRLTGRTISSMRLLALWTRKEAVVKALGKGLSQALSDVVVPIEARLSPQGQWSLARAENGVSAFHCHDITCDSGEYVGCVAAAVRCQIEVQR
ncbi:4'-phosphopantetheinyl transferase superfamily protein [Ensifer sp. ENS06]|uniref:4'-phosphopantetheinyl transferase family protein n=1 Tax=Ensifer sp. ENS06 TaxID=2769276 RepID=UPI00177B72B5|nr:4'-phosphopantetheinyl transferase superfamily protein [Ensifer sp. ENS06]MBD9628178.1 4'-phosphopantetheinyl transferase superfamily protein [Ensifer sp. ENS06]